jgi:hypothetical protein
LTPGYLVPKFGKLAASFQFCVWKNAKDSVIIELHTFLSISSANSDEFFSDLLFLTPAATDVLFLSLPLMVRIPL